MPPYLPVVAVNRSSRIRINNQLVAAFSQNGQETQYPNNDLSYPTYIDLGAEVEGGQPTWKELAEHISIGQLVVVGGLSASNAPVVVQSGVISTADGSDLVITTSQGLLKNRTTGATVIVLNTALTLSAASGSYPRIDIIQVNTTTGVLTKVTGTAAISPVAPAPSTGNVAIAQIAVATSATSVSQTDVTDVAPRA